MAGGGSLGSAAMSKEQMLAEAYSTMPGGIGSKTLGGAGAASIAAMRKGVAGGKPPDQGMDLVWLARKLGLSLNTCKESSSLFTKYAPITRALTREQFTEIMCDLTGCSAEKDLPDGMAFYAFKYADKDGSGSIDFEEFTAWYSSTSFTVSTTVSATEREFRDLCRKHSMPLCTVEKYKRHFDEFDLDSSGSIDQAEFENLIKKCSKVPANVEVPRKRFEQLWKECDANANGEIDFEEFLVFYRKYFDEEANSSSNRPVGFEGFYKNVRRLGPAWRTPYKGP